MIADLQHKDKTLLKQYRLKNLEDGSYIVCWLDGSLKIGAKITLKDEEGKYQVVERYNKELSKDFLDMNRNPKWYTL